MMFGNSHGEKTILRCTECGQEKEAQKPGMSGKSRIKCRNCSEQTIHRMVN